MELSGKTAMISTKPRPPQNCLSLLNRSSPEIILSESRRLSAKQKYFLSILSVKCSGQMSFLWVWWQLAAYLFYDTKDNAAGLCGFIPVSKTITIIGVSLLFQTSHLTGITILSYVLASQTQQYKTGKNI